MRARSLLLLTVFAFAVAALPIAAAQAARTLDRIPDLTDAEVAKIQQDRLAGKSKEAIPALVNHPASFAGKKRALGMLGLLYRDVGARDEAFRIAARDFDYMGSCFEYLQFLGWIKPDAIPPAEPNLPLAVNLMKRALEVHPDDVEAQLGYARAIALNEPTLENANRVLAFKEKAASLPPKLFEKTGADVIPRVAGVLIYTGKHEEAVGLLRAALEIDPTLIDVSLTLARELAAAKNDAEANQILNQIEKDHPERNADVFFLRGLFAKNAGNLDLALTEAEKALTLSGRSHPLALQLSVDIRLGKNDLGQVRTDIDRLAELGRKVDMGFIVDAFYVRYFIARAKTAKDGPDKNNALKEAGQHCDKILSADPKNAPALEWQAEIAKLGGAVGSAGK